MKRVAWTNPDGSVSVMTPVINTHPKPEAITEEQALTRAMKDIPSNAQNVTILEPSSIPTDRSKRYAWRLQGETIVVDPTVSEPEKVRKGRRLEELKSKRRAGSPLNPLEQQEMIDLMAGI